jgi:hypothetical protein
MDNLTNAARGGNFCFNSAALTGLSGAANTFTTTNAINYSVKGAVFNKAAVAGGATPTTDVTTGKTFNAQAINTAAVYVWTVDASGNIGVAQGAIKPYTDTSANSTALDWPALADTVTPFAYVVIKNEATGATFNFGTTDWNAAGLVIDPVVNVSLLPATEAITA